MKKHLLPVLEGTLRVPPVLLESNHDEIDTTIAPLTREGFAVRLFADDPRVNTPCLSILFHTMQDRGPIHQVQTDSVSLMEMATVLVTLATLATSLPPAKPGHLRARSSIPGTRKWRRDTQTHTDEEAHFLTDTVDGALVSSDLCLGTIYNQHEAFRRNAPPVFLVYDVLHHIGTDTWPMLTTTKLLRLWRSDKNLPEQKAHAWKFDNEELLHAARVLTLFAAHAATWEQRVRTAHNTDSPTP